MNIYEFTVKDAAGNDVPLSSFEANAMLLVNTASKCGFTPQYEQLEQLYQKYKEQGFVILAFPCNQFMGQEPGDNEEIQSFCKLHYGVTFPVMAKVDVNGENAIPLYRDLVSFTTFVGFDKNHPIGAKLDEILSAENPDYEKDNAIKWNFTKFLVDKNGEIVARYEPTTPVEEIEEKLTEIL